MTRGPDQQRLLDYLPPEDRSDLHSAEDQWRKGADLLGQLANELRNRAIEIRRSNERVFTGQTATTAAQAFDDTAKTMDTKAKDMSDGATAFGGASQAITAARHTSKQLEKHGPGSLPKDPGIPPGSSQPEDVKAQHQYDTAVSSYWQTYHANEQTARDAIAKLEDKHRAEAKVFQRIHGEHTATDPGGGGGGNPVNQGTRPTTTHVPGAGQTDHNTKPGPTHTVTDTHGGVIHLGIPDETYGLPPHHTTTPTTPTSSGVPQGQGTQGTHFPAGPSQSGPVGGVGTVGGGAGAVGGIGAAAGGALGGAAAAGLAAGGLNGGLNGLMPAGGGVRGGLSAAGVRGIGATSRTGVGSVLGRGTGATGRAGTGGMAGRSGGGRGTGRGTGRGSRGSQGRAGTRAGAGAGASRGGKDKKRQGDERDLFDDGSDWIDDEDAAPGLID